MCLLYGGIGKAKTAAAIGKISQQSGHKVTFLKFDPYLNYDSGHISPHGEVFILEDWRFTDMDFGLYERMCKVNFKKKIQFHQNIDLIKYKYGWKNE